MIKKTYVIGCAVLALDMKQAAQDLGLNLEYKFLEAGLHENPRKLNTKLQKAIDEISVKKDAERIIIGYGVCGKGTVGIHSRGIPLVIPKVHDCISLFLGGDEAYKTQFRKFPGTYYLSAGWCEAKSRPMSQRRMQAFFGAEILEYDELVKSHGEKAADTTFEFLNSWQQNYQRAAFIKTAAKNSPRHEAQAREMAEEYGWEFAHIQGEPALIQQMLTLHASTPEVLVVPPDHVIFFDAITSNLSAHPVWQQGPSLPGAADTPEEEEEELPESLIKIGLGIDAGGTYTDAVIYDLKTNATLAKAKSLTTKWDFTVGIGKALAKLDAEQVKKVEMVALSTTLATNAIVENEGQKVGMFIMPPFGMDPNIPYEPKALIKGQLEITGKVREEIDPDQIRAAADRMISQGATAFAVSGYAGSINPDQELAVKAILADHTGFFVSCGHELSDSLNFQTRAVTAMLNARIIPRLTGLLTDLEKVMARRDIQAPIVVVKGDGTLMSADMAKERPVETILSGPAASVAGARHITGQRDALVIDMGGTTSDTAALADGLVSLNDQGSNVGGHRTHVKALDIRTTGLGGDSVIGYEKGEYTLGPNRVAPIAWLATNREGTAAALDYLNMNLSRFASSTRKMQIITATGSAKEIELSPMEKQVMALVSERPHSIDELVVRMDVLTDAGLPLAKLEENFMIQRCGLTPTDLLHIKGEFVKWDVTASQRFADMLAFLCRREAAGMIDELLDKAVIRLAMELLKKEIDEDTDSEALEDCPVCKVLLDNLLAGGNSRFRVGIELKRPVIGIGAPIKFFLDKAVRLMGGEPILPEDADVANAIGAITSNVVVQRQIRIIPAEIGGFSVEGVSGTQKFRNFEDADAFAREALSDMVRAQALEAGTSCKKVVLRTHDQIPRTAGGDPIFMSRIIKAKITGRPDRVMAEKVPA